MKEMGGHAEETQTNTAMFARQIHEKKRGETVNTDTQTAIQKALEACLSASSATETGAPERLGGMEHMAGVEGHVYPKGRIKHCILYQAMSPGKR